MIFKNQAYDLPFNAGEIGHTWTAYVSKDGGDYVLIEGNVVERTLGGYVVEATAGDMNGNILEFYLVSDGVDPLKYGATIVTDDPFIVQRILNLDNLDMPISDVYNVVEVIAAAVGVGDGTEVWVYTMYADVALTIPLDGCRVKITLDAAGTVSTGEQISNSLGQTRWLVNRNRDYYMWRRMIGYKFDDPDLEHIPAVGVLSMSGRFRAA